MTEQILRGMAWQRAKGELRSILETYTGDSEEFEKANEVIEDFIAHVEDHSYGIT